MSLQADAHLSCELVQLDISTYLLYNDISTQHCILTVTNIFLGHFSLLDPKWGL